MKLFKILFGFLLLLQTSLFANLSAVGYGSSEKEAKASALSELSNSVSANVKSNLTLSTKVQGSKVTKGGTKKLNVASSTYFQGVQYTQMSQKGGTFEVTAFLDKKGVENTLVYIQKELHKDLAKLRPHALKELLKKSEMGYALANFSVNKEMFQTDFKAQEEDVQKYLSYAQITFNVKPSDAVIRVNHAIYTPLTTYLVPSTVKYTFEISANGYYTEEGTLTLSQGEKRTIIKQLIKKSNNAAKVYVDVKSNIPEFKDTVSGLLLNYGVGVTPRAVATNSIRFTFDKQFITEVSGMKVYRVTVVMSVYKGSTKIMLKKVRLKNVVDGNYVHKVNRGVKALTKYLLKKQDMKTFIGKQSVNYDDI